MVIEPIPIHDQATRHSGKRGTNQDGKGNGLGIGKEGDCRTTITGGDKHAVAFNWQSGGDVRHNPSASVPDALTAHQTPACFLPGQGSKAQGIGYEVGVAPTLRSGCDNYGLHTQMQVRRLTPTECERLQGFPDNFTRIPWRNKTPENCPDGPRYKAIGNSMAIPCVKFIADRIKEQLG
jgi:DNA (cytosine-5)-methyltransferase 1